MKKIEHIGVAVASMQEARAMYDTLLGTEPYKIEEVSQEGVTVVFYQIGETKIELLVPSNDQSPIANYLNKKGAGLHHVAFHVDDISSEIKRLEGEGFELIKGYPRAGADQKVVAFFHPKTTQGVLVELCQPQK